ncbi:Sec7_family protein [Hexamita inflata]|uniref:Sec7 family protein n=1 Tax=Hexamita inflata TaxID=28002 RepID=A0AA86R4P9_9EUKA|nr:Sec7 family protein [Hexamita inflata]
MQYQAKILNSLEKRIPKKLQGIKLALDSILKDISSENFTIDSQQTEEEPMETLPTELGQSVIEPSKTMSNLSLISLSQQSSVERQIRMYFEIQQQKQSQGSKTYELSIFALLCGVGNQQDLRCVQQILGEKFDQTLSPMHNLYLQISPFMQDEILYARLVFIHLCIIRQIQYFKPEPKQYHALKATIAEQFKLLYRYKEGNIEFYEDGRISDFSKKDLLFYQEAVFKIFPYKLESDLIDKSSTCAMSPVKVETTIVPLLMENFQLQLKYILDQKYVKSNQFNLEAVFFEAIKDQLTIFEKKPVFMCQFCDQILKCLSKINQSKIISARDENYIKFNLLIMNKMFQLSLCTDELNLFKSCCTNIRQLHLEIIAIPQMRLHFYHLMKAFIISVFDSDQKSPIKLQCMQLISYIFNYQNNTDLINIYLQIYDLNGIAPFVCDIFKAIINQLQNFKHLEQHIQFKGFTQISLHELVFQHLNVQFESEKDSNHLEIVTHNELAMTLLLRFLRCISSKQIEILNVNAMVEQKFTFFGCCERFNKSENPLKSFSTFINEGLTTTQSSDIVKFIVENNRYLNKKLIGEMFGGNKDVNKNLLSAYKEYVFRVFKCDPSNMAVHYLQSLRVFLSFFKIPGEAQQIDRILQKFSFGFSENSKMKQESAYILSYATMMLNTDIHNHAVKEKMSCSDFVRNTKRADKHNDFEDQFLKNLFEEINANPLTLDEVEQARAIGLYGEVGLFKYHQDKNCSELYTDFKLNQLFEYDQSDKDGVSSNGKEDVDANQYTAPLPLSEQLAQHLSPVAPFKQLVPMLNENFTLELETKEEEKDEKFEELSVRNDEECAETIKQSTMNLKVADQLQSIINQLMMDNKVQDQIKYLIDYFFTDILQTLLKYLEYTFLKHHRYQFTTELVANIYRLASINVNCKAHRSKIIEMLALNVHLALQQFFPFSGQLVQLYPLKKSLILLNSDFHPDDMSMMTKNVVDDMKLALVLLIGFDGDIDQNALEIILSAYMSSLSIIQMRCKDDQNYMILEKQFDKEKYPHLQTYELFITEFAKSFNNLQNSLDQVQNGCHVKNGAVLQFLPCFKTIQALINLMEYYMIDGQITNQINGAQRINTPLQYGCVQMLQKTVTELFSFLTLFDKNQNMFQAPEDGLLSRLKYRRLEKDSRSYLTTVHKTQLDQNSLFKMCESVYDTCLAKIGSLMIFSRYYSQNYNYSLLLAQQLKALVGKYISTIQTFDIPCDIYAPHIFLTLSHLVKPCTVSSTLQVLCDTVLHLYSTMNENQFTQIQHVMPFIMCSLHRILTPNILSVENIQSTQLSCKSNYHNICGCYFCAPMTELMSLKPLAPTNQSWSTCFSQIQTILNVLANKIDILTPDNVTIYFKYILDIITNFKEIELTRISLRICDKIVRKMFELEIWDVVDALDALCQQVVEVNMINKSFLSTDVLQNSLSTFVQVFMHLIFAPSGFWCAPENKIRAVHAIYSKRVRNLILLQRKDKSYLIIQQLIVSLVSVYQSSVQSSKEACLLIVDDLLLILQEFLSVKVPSLDKFEWLIDECVTNIFNTVGLDDNESKVGIQFSLQYRVEQFNKNVLQGLISQDEIMSDDFLLKSMFGQEVFVDIRNSKEQYLLTYIKCLFNSIKENKLSHKLQLAVMTDLHNTLRLLLKMSKTMKIVDNALIMNLIAFLCEHVAISTSSTGDLFGIINFFDLIGFDMLMTMCDIVLEYCNHVQSKIYLDCVIQLIISLERIIETKHNQTDKMKTLHLKAVQFLLFDQREVRVELMKLFQLIAEKVVSKI